MVVHIITRLALGGAQQIVYELSKRLKESGVDVIVLQGSLRQVMKAQSIMILF